MLATILIAAEHMTENAAEAANHMNHMNHEEILPEALHFLKWGWWVVHLVAIPLVFIIGYAVGKSGKGAEAGTRTPPQPQQRAAEGGSEGEEQPTGG